MSPRTIGIWIAGAAIAISLAGCASEDSDSGIASVADITTTGSPTVEASADAVSAEDQALEFAACMRSHGVDFPDPSVDSDGEPVFDEALEQVRAGGFDPSDAAFTAAFEDCGDLLDGVTFGGGALGEDFDASEIEEALYAYTDCLRDEGLDVGDISIDLADGAGVGDGAATGTSSGSDSSDRFALRLGYDPDDPEWVAADAVCQPVLQSALAGAVGGEG